MSASLEARIGLDIGGTSTAGVAFGPTGEIEAEVQLPTIAGDDGILDTIERAIAKLSEQSGRACSEFVSLGIGIPGQINHELGLVRHAYNIGVDRLALGPLLQERFGIPVSLDNDVAAAAIGAAHVMRLKGTVAYLNLGTGLAASCVIDGQPLRGAHGVTGEIGHLAIDPLKRPCQCGQRGCLETVASGSALTSFWRPDASGRLLLKELENGDHAAKQALTHLIAGAAAAVRLLILTFDPHTLVIGGGLRLLGSPLIDGIHTTLDAWTHGSPFLANFNMSSRIQILPPGSSAASVGAALSYQP